MTDCETSNQNSISAKSSKAISEVKTEIDCLESGCDQEVKDTLYLNQETKEGSRKQTKFILKNSIVYVKAKYSNTSEGVAEDQVKTHGNLNCKFTENDEINGVSKTNISFTKECSVVLTRCDETSPGDAVVAKNFSSMNVESKSRIAKSKKSENNLRRVGKKHADVVGKSQNSSNQATNRKVARHSIRASCKRMKFEDDDLEITEIIPTDPLAPNSLSTNLENGSKKIGKVGSTKNNTIVVKNTEQLFQIANGKGVKRKKEPTLVIIDTNSILSGKGPVPVSQLSLVSPISQQPIISGYSILPAASNSWSIPSGTSIQTSLQTFNHNTFAIPKKSPYTSSQLSHQNVSAIHLIEAPSFIVPYLYALPPKQSLKKYVEQFQKEKKENNCMEDNNSIKITNNNYQQSSTEKNRYLKKNCDENGETTHSEMNEKDKIANDMNKTSLTESEVQTNNETKEKNNDFTLIQGKSQAQVIENSKSVKEILLKEKVKGDKGAEKKYQDYFKSTLGNFFFDIGLNLAKEFVHNDLSKTSESIVPKSIEQNQTLQFRSNNLGINLDCNVEDNKPFFFELKKCVHCNFQTESSLVMAHHLEIPHVYNNAYKCNFCNLVSESCSKLVYHVAIEHNRHVLMESPPALHQCPFCVFEDNNKSRVNSHTVYCSKKFKPDRNLEPSPGWEPPAKIIHVTRNPPSKRAKATSSYQMSSKGVRQLLPKLPSNTVMHYAGISTGQHNVHATPKDQTVKGQKRQNISKQQTAVWQRPNISITPLPNVQNGVSGTVNVKNSLQRNPVSLLNKSQKLNICEICDSHFGDFGNLQIHLRDIHHAKFSKKALHSTPSLGCQKCPLRFFTDQGLERHLLGTHGLVTTSIQEAAKNEKDGGHCPICAKLFQKNLLDHMNKEHKINLKPVNISYKCTLCTTVTFGKYQQFEDHVFAVHSGSKPKNNSASSPNNLPKDVLKSLKENNEITIISHSKPNHHNSSDSFGTQINQRIKKSERINSNQLMNKHKTHKFYANCSVPKENDINIPSNKEENINHFRDVKDEIDENISKINHENCISGDHNSGNCLASEKKNLTGCRMECKSTNAMPYCSYSSQENISDETVPKSKKPKNVSEEDNLNENDKILLCPKEGKIDHDVQSDSSMTINEIKGKNNKLPINENEQKRNILDNELLVSQSATDDQRPNATSMLQKKINYQNLDDNKYLQCSVELVHLEDSSEKENKYPRDKNISNPCLEENIRSDVSENEKMNSCLLERNNQNEEFCNINRMDENPLCENTNYDPSKEECIDKNGNDDTVNNEFENMKVLPFTALQDTICLKQSSSSSSSKSRGISRHFKISQEENNDMEVILVDESVHEKPREQTEESECDIIDDQK